MQVITANRLTDGLVVYLDAGGRWTTDIAAARLLDADDAVAAALAEGQAAAGRQEIVDPYAVAVVAGAKGVAPQSLRERIRAFG
ncbi:DUF2849 domain-containing protein, partial [Mycobacterium tuberculosis]|nr:DUF2849 domain-containing protein [Mycobacterium tuberculosis]